jgi:TolA-binding protein
MWTWIAVVVLAVLVPAVAAAKLLGRLGGLRRATVRLQRRQAEAMRLQETAEELRRTLDGLQQRSGELQERIARIAPNRGRG